MIRIRRTIDRRRNRRMIDLVMPMGTNFKRRCCAIACAIIFTLTPALANAAPGRRAPRLAHYEGAWNVRDEFARAGNALPADRAKRMVLAHLDEQNIPSAENPGSPAFPANAPANNAGSAANWERLPDTNAPASAPGSPPAGPAGDVATGALAPAAGNPAAAAQSAQSNPTSGAWQSVPATPIGSMASMQRVPPASANNAMGGAPMGAAGYQPPNPGPPPALDLGAIQSGPDLASVSLADEIKKAETPARAAALRVTEQARVNLAAGRTDEALRDLGRAVSIDPGNPFGYFYLGRVYIARRNYAQALTFFKRAEIGFRARPDWLGESIGFEGACYEELGQFTAAAMTYRRALGAAPNDLRARVGYSRLSNYLPVAATADASAALAPYGTVPPPPAGAAAGSPPIEDAAPPPPAP
jgi:Tetratricopeptide repeat